MSRSTPGRGRSRRWIRMCLFTGGVAALLAACRQAYPYNSLNPAGPVAEKQDDLFTLVFWIAAVVFVLVEGLLVFAMIRFRQRSPEDAPKQVHGNTRLEIAWTILPALLLAGVAVPTVGTIFDLASRPSGDVVEVNVTGHQWWWEVEYPGLQVVTANEIHIPTDRPAVINLTSKDVIHSFWVPRLAGKQDLVPGRTTSLNIEAPTPGTYLGECAEFCGLSHSLMLFRVVAQEPQDFEAWVNTQRQPAVAPAPDSEEAEGLEYFQNFGTGSCIACHTVNGIEGATAEIGPNLTHVGGRQTIAAGILRNDQADLARWLRNPPGVKPGSKMPDYNLTEQQIEALVAYLRSLT